MVSDHNIMLSSMSSKTNLFLLFLNEGEKILGRKKLSNEEFFKSRNLERDFRTLFGCSPVTCSVIWVKCDFSHQVKRKHLLWALMFLKTYGTEATLTVKAGISDRKCFRETIWPIIKKIASLRKREVSTQQKHLCIFNSNLFYIFYL